MSDRQQQLKNAGIITDGSNLSKQAADVIDSMTDDEFHSILTVRAKINDDSHRKDMDGFVHSHGF